MKRYKRPKAIIHTITPHHILSGSFELNASGDDNNNERQSKRANFTPYFIDEYDTDDEY